MYGKWLPSLSYLRKLSLDVHGAWDILTPVFIWVSVAVMKHHEQSNLGRKGFLWLALPQHCSSSKEVKTGTQVGQEPGGRSSCRGNEGVLLTGLFPVAYSACVLIAPRPISPEMTPPTVGWARLSNQ